MGPECGSCSLCSSSCQVLGSAVYRRLEELESLRETPVPLAAAAVIPMMQAQGTSRGVKEKPAAHRVLSRRNATLDYSGYVCPQLQKPTVHTQLAVQALGKTANLDVSTAASCG